MQCRVVAAKKSIFSMDLQWPLIATGCANGEVRVWDMQRLQIPAPAPSSPVSPALGTPSKLGLSTFDAAWQPCKDDCNEAALTAQSTPQPCDDIPGAASWRALVQHLHAQIASPSLADHCCSHQGSTHRLPPTPLPGISSKRCACS